MSRIPDDIRSFLEKHEAATALELSQVLACTPANIRYHLGRLQSHGVVEVISTAAGSHRGRPTLVYSLSPSTREQNISGLAAALLKVIMEGNSEETDRRLARAASLLAGPQLPIKAHLTRRLTDSVRRLRELKYHARWEAHSDGPRIFLEHCPYASLLTQHAAELCRIDGCLISMLIGVKARQVSKPGAHPCEFVLD